MLVSGEGERRASAAGTSRRRSWRGTRTGTQPDGSEAEIPIRDTRDYGSACVIGWVPMDWPGPRSGRAFFSFVSFSSIGEELMGGQAARLGAASQFRASFGSCEWLRGFRDAMQCDARGYVVLQDFGTRKKQCLGTLQHARRSSIEAGRKRGRAGHTSRGYSHVRGSPREAGSRGFETRE
jgi:hypothetical protein